MHGHPRTPAAGTSKLGLWSLTLPSWATRRLGAQPAHPHRAVSRNSTPQLATSFQASRPPVEVMVPASLPSRLRSASAFSVAPKPDWRARMRVLLTQRTLDDQIAQGSDVTASLALSLRAKQLTGTGERRAASACLANILDAAEERQADPGLRLILDHRAVIASRAEILALIDVLRSGSEVNAQGVALTTLLIERRTSPLFGACTSRTLEQAIAEIAEAL
jgi:hypothetical protein